MRRNFHQLTAFAWRTYTARRTMVLIGVTALDTANGAHPEAIDSWQGRSHEVTASLTSAYGLAGRKATVWRVDGARTQR